LETVCIACAVYAACLACCSHSDVALVVPRHWQAAGTIQDSKIGSSIAGKASCESRAAGEAIVPTVEAGVIRGLYVGSYWTSSVA